MKTLLIGKTSLLARQFQDWRVGLGLAPCDALSHGAVTGPNDLTGYEVIVPFALDPRFKSDPYNSQIDYERRIATWVRETGASLVMISTRMVYGGTAKWQAVETETGIAETPYGRNKREAEQHIEALLGDRATILRLANCSGFEYPEPGRRAFMAMVLSKLKTEGVIRYDMNRALRRDFLPFPYFAEILNRMIEQRPGGIWNAGSGIALPTGQLADWVIEGYGTGHLEIEDRGSTDEFVLDMTKTRQLVNQKISEADLKTFFVGLGQRLRKT